MSLHTYRIKLPVASFYTFAYVVIFYENNKTVNIEWESGFG